MAKQPLAVLCSDLHLSHTPPSARAGDWYGAMAYGLSQLTDLSRYYDVPIICAGDVFDKWQSPPELVNFALDCLPPMWAICGQHDLPNHNYAEVHRSAFRILTKAGRIEELPDGQSWHIRGRLTATGFRWGRPITPPRDTNPEGLSLAVVHSYIWVEGCGYHDAPEGQKLKHYFDKLAGYDAAVWGDNHKGFMTCWLKSEGPYYEFNLLNSGTFFARHSDERNYKPHVGILYDDASIERHYLDTSKDQWADADNAIIKPELNFDAAKFLEGLQTLGMDALDYRAAVGRALDELGAANEVRKLVTDAMELKNGK